jgi:hypothetical protein
MEFLRGVYNTLLRFNVAHILVLGLVIKALITDVSYPAFLLTIPILSYEAYKLYIKHKTPDVIQFNSELRKELDNMKAKLNAQTLDKNIKPQVERYF